MQQELEKRLTRFFKWTRPCSFCYYVSVLECHPSSQSYCEGKYRNNVQPSVLGRKIRELKAGFVSVGVWVGEGSDWAHAIILRPTQTAGVAHIGAYGANLSVGKKKTGPVKHRIAIATVFFRILILPFLWILNLCSTLRMMWCIALLHL